jgi:HSP20 family molecular chaperone IbpA
MVNDEALKPGREVFIRRPIQVYATVVGTSRDQAGLVCVRLQPLKQYYRVEDLEPSQRPAGKPSIATDFYERQQEIAESITRRAYELFEARGFKHGHDSEDWMRAQSEILIDVPVEIRETETQLSIRAEVPGFGDQGLDVRFTPRAVCISGTRQDRLEKYDGNKVYSEFRASEIFRILDLPAEIDPTTADVALDEGIVEIKVAKVAAVEKAAPLAMRASA